jgi:hypothetical protein
MIYIITPILDKILTVFGIFFIPERYGGGSEAQNPGMIQLIFQGLIQNGISAYCAIKASMIAFSNANNKAVAVSLMIFVCIGVIAFTYVIFQKDGFIAIIVPITMAPSIYFAVELWKNEDI